jgi:hypothetical protein
MPTDVDVANRSLSAISTRSTIASLTENSNEARQAQLLIYPVRDEVLRMANWNCATTFQNLALVCAAPGTPENPSAGMVQWEKGIPPPPWAYEYLYPSDCLRPLYIVPQFSTGFNAGVPITTAVTGGAPSFWNGPVVRYRVAVDQLINGLPATGGADQRVILTNQEFAILCYLKKVTDPDVMDENFVQAWVAALAGRLAYTLTGDKMLANDKIKEANNYINLARQVDGNEGLTINDVTPDYIRTRGLAYPGWEYSPNIIFDWGPQLSMY